MILQHEFSEVSALDAMSRESEKSNECLSRAVLANTLRSIESTQMYALVFVRTLLSMYLDNVS